MALWTGDGTSNSDIAERLDWIQSYGLKSAMLEDHGVRLHIHNAFTRSSETIKGPPCSSERARGIQMKAAVPLEPPRSDGVKVLLRHLNRNALHDLLNSEHHSKPVLYPYYDAFHPPEWAGLNERTLTRQKKWMRFNLSLGQSRTERTDRCIGNGCRLPPYSPDHCKRTGNAEYASTISPIDTHKEVAGKQRKIETHFRSAAPLALAAKKGEGSAQYLFVRNAMQRASHGGRLCKPRTTSKGPTGRSHYLDLSCT